VIPSGEVAAGLPLLVTTNVELPNAIAVQPEGDGKDRNVHVTPSADVAQFCTLVATTTNTPAP
jgi:hypothetical protein